MEQNFFQKNNYNVVKEAITSEMAFFLNKYFHNKSNVGCLFFLRVGVRANRLKRLLEISKVK